MPAYEQPKWGITSTPLLNSIPDSKKTNTPPVITLTGGRIVCPSILHPDRTRRLPEVTGKVQDGTVREEGGWLQEDRSGPAGTEQGGARESQVG